MSGPVAPGVLSVQTAVEEIAKPRPPRPSAVRVEMAHADETYVFTVWVNNKLAAIGEPALRYPLLTAFRDTKGLLADQLLLALKGVMVGYKPSDHPAICRGNIQAVLQRFQDGDAQISINTISAENLYSGYEEYVLAFIWALIRRFDSSAAGVTKDQWISQTKGMIDRGQSKSVGVAQKADPGPSMNIQTEWVRNNRASEDAREAQAAAMRKQQAEMEADLQRVQTNYSVPPPNAKPLQLQNQPAELMLQQQEVQMTIGGRPYSVLVHQQMIRVNKPGQTCYHVPGQPVTVQLPQQPVQLLCTINGQQQHVQLEVRAQPVQAMIQQLPAAGQTQIQILILQQPLQLIIEQRPVVVYLMQHQHIIIILPTIQQVNVVRTLRTSFGQA